MCLRIHLAPFRRQLLEAGLLVAFNVDPDNGQAWVRVNPQNEDAARALLARVLDAPPS
jgi:hypothetical protein